MIFTYKLSGMTCEGCTQIVRDSILKVAGVKKVNIDLSQAQANVEMENYIPIEILKTALADSLYEISEVATSFKNKQKSRPSEEVSKNNKHLITSYLQALSQLDYDRLNQYLHSNFSYKGELSFNNASDYVTMIKDHANSPVSDVLLKNDIKAIFTDENESCVIYDSVTRFPGKKVSFVEWIKIEDGKIASTEVKFNRNQMKQLMEEMSKTEK